MAAQKKRREGRERRLCTQREIGELSNKKMAMNSRLEALQTLAARLAPLKDAAMDDLKRAKGSERAPQSWANDEKLTGAVANMTTSAKSVGDCATKLVLVLKDPATKADAAESICKEFGHGVEVLVTTLALLEGCTPGAPLWLEAMQTAHAFVCACVDLVGVISLSVSTLSAATAKSAAGGSGKKKNLKGGGAAASKSSSIEEEEEQKMARACGLVWNLGEAKFKQLPKTNRVAYRRAVMTCSSMVKETIDEFQEIVDAGVKEEEEGSDDDDEGGGGSSGGGGSGGGDLDDFDFFGGGGGDDGEGDQYTAAEMPVAVASLKALVLMRPTLKTALDALDVAGTLPPSPASSPSLSAAATALPPPPGAGRASSSASSPIPLVIAGPSGVGKGTLIAKVLQELPGMFGFSVSHTTRAPRAGEENGKDYHFSTKEAMEKEIAAGGFLEHANVHGNFYGTSFDAVKDVAGQGKVCILDIDVQGCKSVKACAATAMPQQPHFIFIAPPSMEVLSKRLTARGTETPEKVQLRLSAAKGEVEYGLTPGNMELVIVNDVLEEAFQELVEQLAKWYPNQVKKASPGPAHGNGNGGSGKGRSSSLAAVARVYTLCRKGADACTELGAALYPALDMEEIASATAPLAAVTTELSAALAAIADDADASVQAVKEAAAAVLDEEGGAASPDSLAVDLATKATLADSSSTIPPPAPPPSSGGTSQHGALRKVGKVWNATLPEIQAAIERSKSKA
jgi:guanylate kinase